MTDAPPFTEFTAAILEANARQSADAVNRVVDNLTAELAEVRANYRAFFLKVQTINERLDSLSIERLLAHHEGRALHD